MPIKEVSVKTIRSDRLCFRTDNFFEIQEAREVKGFINNVKDLDISELDKRDILEESINRLLRL
jgi:hypothetical protein